MTDEMKARAQALGKTLGEALATSYDHTPNPLAVGHPVTTRGGVYQVHAFLSNPDLKQRFRVWAAGYGFSMSRGVELLMAAAVDGTLDSVQRELDLSADQ